MATTKISIKLINTVNPTESGAIQTVSAIKIKDIKLNTIIWPAEY